MVELSTLSSVQWGPEGFLHMLTKKHFLEAMAQSIILQTYKESLSYIRPDGINLLREYLHKTEHFEKQIYK